MITKKNHNHKAQGIFLGCIFCPCQIVYYMLFGFYTLNIPLNYTLEV